MTRDAHHAVVVGGGVIGAMCAWYLTKSGHEVTVVDKDKFGAACSHGNCGYVSPSHVLPLTQPGVIRRTLPTLLKPDSPLSIKLRWAPDLWNWLWNFSRRCNHENMMEAAEGRHLLLQSSMTLYQQLIEEEKIECEWTENGLLFVFKSEVHFDHYETSNRIIEDHFGVSADPIEGRALCDLEPALKPDSIAGAWHYRGDRHLRPDKLMSSLQNRLRGMGCRFVENFQVNQFEASDSTCQGIVSTDGDRIVGDVFVVAAGALSPFLNEHLGCRLPIQPGKGYSITMPHPRVVPQTPMVFEEHRVAITPMADKYRIGSTMEFAGYDTSMNRRRLDMLKKSAAIYLHEPYCSPIEEEWFGWRPMTWDGKPVIDVSPSMRNVWIAAGHNMLGISMATSTGKLIQELIDLEEPHLDVEHFRLERLT